MQVTEHKQLTAAFSKILVGPPSHSGKMQINGINLLVTAPGEIQLLETYDLMGGMRRELRELTRIANGTVRRRRTGSRKAWLQAKAASSPAAAGQAGDWGQSSKRPTSNLQRNTKLPGSTVVGPCPMVQGRSKGCGQRFFGAIPRVIPNDSNQFQTLFQRIPKLIPNVFTRISSRFHRYSPIFNDVQRFCLNF